LPKKVIKTSEKEAEEIQKSYASIALLMDPRSSLNLQNVLLLFPCFYWFFWQGSIV